MPHAIEVPDGLEPFPRQQLGVPDDAFLVHCSFDMNSWPARKNPLGVVEVFRRAFDDADARLLLKIRHGATIGFAGSDRERHGDALLELAEDDERILIDIAERSYADTLALIATSNCHISLHRSEGFGYSLAEAMALGVPLLCTDFGGSRDFCTPANSWLVPAVERYLEEGEYWLAPAGATWGEPSLDTAVDLLRQIRAGGAEVQQKLAAARERAASLGLGQMSERYGARLAELLT
jgi:glycosyltransferase involved in cell wall biosynthesis